MGYFRTYCIVLAKHGDKSCTMDGKAPSSCTRLDLQMWMFYPILRYAHITLWNMVSVFFGFDVVLFWWGDNPDVCVGCSIAMFLPMFLYEASAIPWVTIPVYIHTVQSVHALYPQLISSLNLIKHHQFRLIPTNPDQSPMNSHQSKLIPIGCFFFWIDGMSWGFSWGLMRTNQWPLEEMTSPN